MSTAKTNTNISFAGKPNYWIAWEILVNIVLAVFFLQFVLINCSDILSAFRLSTLLMLAKVSADTAFHLIRNPAKKISTSLYDWIIGIGGAFVVFFYRSIDGTDMWIGTGIQLMGCGLQVFAMLSLNRSIGFVAANRGIKTDGMYRFVRHPLYFAYNTAFFGYLLNHFTLHNCLVYAAMVLALYLRSRCEEGVLAQDPEYRDYQKKVPYRVIPYVI